MDIQDEEFLTRLLATFGEEAADHIQSIISGILVLEQDPSLSQQTGIEPVYRATHSLKGAARAVGLKDIEGVCQHLESVFSSVRKGELTLNQEGFDLVHEVVLTLESLLAGNKQVKTAPLIQKLKKIVLSTQSALKSELPKPASHKQNVQDEPSQPDGPVDSAVIIKQETGSTTKIRISEERLTSL
jgi:two-component system chemotaxis sensor kinase CheA